MNKKYGWIEIDEGYYLRLDQDVRIGEDLTTYIGNGNCLFLLYFKIL